MSSQRDAGETPVAPAPPAADSNRFVWHPTYQGRTLNEVETGLEQEIARDQRAYTLAMEGAESQENATLAVILDLERKWGTFDLNWAETDPAALAARIAAFEQERDQRHELFPYASYRSTSASQPVSTASPRSATTLPSLSFAPSSRLIWLAVALVAVLILLILIAQLT